MSAPTRSVVPVSRFPSDFRDLMNEVVIVEHEIGKNKFSEPTYGAPIEVRCRISGTTREVRTAEDLVRVASTIIHLSGIYDVNPQDRITLSDGSHPAILVVNQSSDERGPLYEEILT